MPVKYADRISILVLWSCAVWLFYWLFRAALYTHPNAEDLSLSHPTFTQGAWLFIRHTLGTYDGRYFVNFLHTITPLAFGSVGGYPLVAIAGVIALVLSSYFLFDSLMMVKKRSTFLLALMFSAVHFATVPSLVHQLYWMSSSLVYLWCWVFFLLLLGGSFRLYKSENEVVSKGWLVWSHSMLFAAIGINELMFGVVLLWFVLITFFISKKPDKKWYFLSLLLAGIVFVCFFVLSPGIQGRMGIENQHLEQLSFFGSIYSSLKWYGFFLFSVAKNPVVIAAAVVAGVFSSYFELKPEFNFFSKRNSTFYFLIVLFVVAYAMTLAYFIPIGTEQYYPARIYGTVQFLILFAVLIVCFKLGRYFYNNRLARFFSALLFAVAVIGSVNNVSSIKSLFGNGQILKYDEAMKHRHDILSKASIRQDCYKLAVIPQIENFPLQISNHTEIAPNRSKPHWNLAYEMYYGVDGVMLSTDTLIVHSNLIE